MSKRLFKAANLLYDFLGAGIKLEDGASALIIGGSSDGLGIEICLTLAIDWNINVVNVDTRDMEVVLNRNEAVILEKNYRFVRCRDFTKTKFVLQALTKVRELQLPLTVLVNNMQQGLKTTFNPSFLMGNSAIARLEEYVNANVISVMVTIKYFLNSLVPQTRGILNRSAKFYIINLTSVLTLMTPNFALEYVSSKAALNQFHDGLTSELAIGFQRNCFKTLLIYLPYAKDGHIWENLSTDLCRQVVECLKLGRRGCAMLHADGAKSLHGKIKDNYRYDAGIWRREWPN